MQNYLINHNRVEKLINLLNTPGLHFNISYWLADYDVEWVGEEYSEIPVPGSGKFCSHDHCGTAACVAGHMHIAGMIDIDKVDGYTAIGAALLLPDDEFNIRCYDRDDIDDIKIIGRYVGSQNSYYQPTDIDSDGVSKDTVIERLRKFMKYKYVHTDKDEYHGIHVTFSEYTDPTLSIQINTI